MADNRISKEQGVSGTNIFHGRISHEEFNWKLVGHQALRTFDEMRRTDATVNAALSAIKLPIKQAVFSVDAVGEDKADVLVANVVKDSLSRVVDDPKVMDEILTYQDFGFAVFEMVLEPRTVEGGTYIALAKFAYRKQTTIEAWQAGDGIPGVTQCTSDGKRFHIPEAKLSRFTNRQEGDNYEGISVLRTAYKNFFMKDKLERIDAMGHERQGLGVLDIVKPDGAKPEDESKMEEAARNMRANAQSYLIRPKGWEVGFMDMKAKSMKDIEPSIRYHDRQILKNVLAQFLDLGASGGSGSRATSEDHSRLFEMSVQAVAQYIATVLQDTVVKTIVDLNFTGRAYPKLSVGRISDENIPEISEAFAKFVEAGVLHPRPADENKVRKMIGMGVVEENELEELFDTEKTASEPAAGSGKDEKPKEASTLISQVKQLRASVEEALYADTQRAA